MNETAHELSQSNVFRMLTPKEREAVEVVDD